MPDFKFDSDSSQDEKDKRKKPWVPFPDSDSDDDYFFKRPTTKKIFDTDSEDEALKAKPKPAEVNYNQLVQMSRGVRESPKPESPRSVSSITTQAVISAAASQTAQSVVPSTSATLTKPIISQTTPFADSAKNSTPKQEPAKKIDSIVTLNPLISTKNASSSQPSSIDAFPNRPTLPAQKKSSSKHLR